MNTDTDRLVVFRGTTSECLFAFLDRTDDIDDRKVLAELMQVSYHGTMQVWVRSGFYSGGAILVRVRAVLELFGYASTEWDDLSPAVHTIAQAIGLGVCTTQESLEALGYAHSKQMFRLVLGRQESVTPEREVLVHQYASTLVDSLEQKKLEIGKNIYASSPRLWWVLASVQEQEEAQLSDVMPTQPGSSENENIVDELASVFVPLVQAMLPVARHLNGAGVSADTRRSVRKQLGHGVLGELNGLLEALSSEQGRDRYLAGLREERIVR